MDPHPSNPTVTRLKSPLVAVSRLRLEWPHVRAWERIASEIFAKIA